MLCLKGHPISAKAPTIPKIVFAKAHIGENRDIYLMNVDGSELVNLTNHRADDISPVWSPTGEQILFASNREHRAWGNWDLYLMDADGSNVRKVFSKTAIRRRPTWSHDGKQIAYNYGEVANGFVYIGTIDGEKEEMMAIGSNPAWSPNGEEIAFVEGGARKPKRISIFNMQTRQSKFFFPPKEPSWVGSPAWSQSGDKLAFTWFNRIEFRIEDAALKTIYIVNRDGTGLQQIVEEGTFASSPTWSPRGNDLLYNANDANKDLQIYKIALEGGAPIQLTEPETWNYKGDWFDPTYALPVALQPHLLTTIWGEVKNR